MEHRELIRELWYRTGWDLPDAVTRSLVELAYRFAGRELPDDYVVPAMPRCGDDGHAPCCAPEEASEAAAQEAQAEADVLLAKASEAAAAIVAQAEEAASKAWFAAELDAASAQRAAEPWPRLRPGEVFLSPDGAVWQCLGYPVAGSEDAAPVARSGSKAGGDDLRECRKCRSRLPLDCFRRDASMASGRRNTCKSCETQGRKARRARQKGG